MASTGSAVSSSSTGIKFTPISSKDGVVVILGGEGTRYNTYEEYMDALAENLKISLQLLQKLIDKGVKNITVYLPDMYKSKADYLGAVALQSGKSTPFMDALKEMNESIMDKMSDKKASEESITLLYEIVAGAKKIRDTTFDWQSSAAPMDMSSKILALRQINPLTHVFAVAHGARGGNFDINSQGSQMMPMFPSSTSITSPLLINSESSPLKPVQVYLNACHGESYTQGKRMEDLLRSNIKFISIAKEKDVLDSADKIDALISLLSTGSLEVSESFYVDVKTKSIPPRKSSSSSDDEVFGEEPKASSSRRGSETSAISTPAPSRGEASATHSSLSSSTMSSTLSSLSSQFVSGQMQGGCDGSEPTVLRSYDPTAAPPLMPVASPELPAASDPDPKKEVKKPLPSFIPKNPPR